MEWTRGRTIGRGSTATVSIATAYQSGHVFAVKSSEISQSESLRREQWLLSALSCPQLVAYKGCGISSENGKLLYNLFLEYAPSGTVVDAIHNHGGRLDEALVRSYTRGILLGLEFLHSTGIVHCDIKGQNVLVTDDGVKIADLGCAKRADGVSSEAWSVAGTPVYMAPEVARGEHQGFPADIWALGCTVIEMATGRAPWPDITDPVSALYKIGFSADVPEIPANVSKQAKDFLSKCLSRDPVERWSATELLAHDFVKESKIPVNKIESSRFDSPCSVLQQHLWKSMEELETVQNLNRSLRERIKQLGEDSHGLSVKIPNWESDENWITVRSHSILPGRQDHLDEPTSGCGRDMSLVIDHYYLTKIRGQNIDNSCNKNGEIRYNTSSVMVCKCTTWTCINDKYYFPMHFLERANCRLFCKLLQQCLLAIFSFINHLRKGRGICLFFFFRFEIVMHIIFSTKATMKAHILPNNFSQQSPQ